MLLHSWMLIPSSFSMLKISFLGEAGGWPWPLPWPLDLSRDPASCYFMKRRQGVVAFLGFHYPWPLLLLPMSWNLHTVDEIRAVFFSIASFLFGLLLNLPGLQPGTAASLSSSNPTSLSVVFLSRALLLSQPLGLTTVLLFIFSASFFWTIKSVVIAFAPAWTSAQEYWLYVDLSCV